MVFGWRERILGVLNTGVDRGLREQDNPTEWMLNGLDFFRFIGELCLMSMSGVAWLCRWQYKVF